MISRIGLTSISHFLRSTPTAGLEVLFDVPPILMRLRQLAALGHLRIQGRNPPRWDGIGLNKKRGHCFLNQKMIEDLGLGGHTLDAVPKTRIWNKSYSVDITEHDGCHSHNTLIIYTDGSLKDERAGYGANFTINEITIMEMKGALPHFTTVCQAEIIAIHKPPAERPSWI